MDGNISDMHFNPSREVYDKDHKKLFGFIACQQGRKLIMITEIYVESRKKEIIEKTKMMAVITEMVVKKQGVDRVCVVDSKDVNEQLARYNIDPLKLDKDKKQDVIIEVEDWVRGGFVSVDFTMGICRANDGKIIKGEK